LKINFTIVGLKHFYQSFNNIPPNGQIILKKGNEPTLGLYGARVVHKVCKEFNSQSPVTFVATAVVDTRVIMYPRICSYNTISLEFI